MEGERRDDGGNEGRRWEKKTKGQMIERGKRAREWIVRWREMWR